MNSTKPVITIIVPTYNQEEYISETIESILRQIVTVPYRIVIADDCSTDNTGAICDKYAVKYPTVIKAIKRSRNQGLIINLFSALLQECNIKYIAFCAGDDFWIDNHKLQKQYEYLETHKKTSVIHTGFRKLFQCDSSYQDISVWESPLLNHQGRKNVKSVLLEEFSFFPVGSSIFFRGDGIIKFLENNNHIWTGNNVPGEGMIIFSYLAMTGSFFFLNDITTVYRILGNSASHFKDKSKKNLFDIRYHIQKINVSECMNLSFFIKYKLVIKFVLCYLYSCRDGLEYDFFRLMQIQTDGEESKNVALAAHLISVLHGNHAIRNSVMALLGIKLCTIKTKI